MQRSKDFTWFCLPTNGKPSLDKDRVVVFVTRGAATEQNKRFRSGIGQLMRPAWRDSNGIQGPNFRFFAIDFHESRTFKDIIDLLCLGMIMFGGRSPGRQGGFGETLVSDRRVSIGQEFPDFGSVLGDEGSGRVPVNDVHSKGINAKTQRRQERKLIGHRDQRSKIMGRSTVPKVKLFKISCYLCHPSVPPPQFGSF